MNDYYKKLLDYAKRVAAAADRYDDQDLVITPPEFLEFNAPLIYLKFTYEGVLSLAALTYVSRCIEQFCSVEGGNVLALNMYRRGQGFVVKIMDGHLNNTESKE